MPATKMILRLQKSMPVLIALFGFVIMLQGCGPSQEELTIGALKHFHRGNQLFSGNDPRAAISEYKMAITLDKKQPVFYFNMGLAYYRLVLYNQAIEAYRTAIKQNPKFGEAWYNLSLALDKVGETDLAFLAYEKYQTISHSKTEPNQKTDQSKPIILQKTGKPAAGKTK